MIRRASAVMGLLGSLVVGLTCAAGPARAQGGPGFFWYGDDLLAACTGDGVAARRSCAGYLMGIVDMIAQLRNDGAAVRACVPFNIAEPPVLDATVGYLREHPELRRRPASMTVTLALAARYPCP